MAYYQDPAYRARARRAVVRLGEYFTARERLGQALGFDPANWFGGATPRPEALARIEAFLAVAEVVDFYSHDQRATGRFLAKEQYGPRLEQPDALKAIEPKAKAFFASGVPLPAARANWLKTLTEKHPRLQDGLEPAPATPAALELLLADVI
jgi:hypothetical protein